MFPASSISAIFGGLWLILCVADSTVMATTKGHTGRAFYAISKRQGDYHSDHENHGGGVANAVEVEASTIFFLGGGFILLVTLFVTLAPPFSANDYGSEQTTHRLATTKTDADSQRPP